MSASWSDQRPELTNCTLIAEWTIDFNQPRSAITPALMGMVQWDQDFLLILRYISVKAGQPQGSTFSIQLIWLASHCHDQSVGAHAGVFRKSSILETTSEMEVGDREILPALMSTQNPIILMASPCSCLWSSKGQAIASQRNSSWTWQQGCSFPWYQTRLLM